MRISLMSQSKYDELFKNLNYIADEIKETNSNPKDNYFIKAYYKETGYIFDESETIKADIDFDPLSIVEKLNPESDSDTAELIHSSFIGLDPIGASYKFFWSTLTHREYWDYTQKRWPLKDSPINIIRARWFFEDSDRNAFSRNAISRLWWSANLTFKPWEKEESLNIFESEDPYKYTKILTSSSQLIQDILDRKWGSNLIFRICFLEAFSRIMNKKEISKTKLSSKLSIIFRACLIPDIILLAEKEPLALINYIEEAYEGLA